MKSLLFLTPLVIGTKKKNTSKSWLEDFLPPYLQILVHLDKVLILVTITLGKLVDPDTRLFDLF